METYVIEYQQRNCGRMVWVEADRLECTREEARAQVESVKAAQGGKWRYVLVDPTGRMPAPYGL